MASFVLMVTHPFGDYAKGVRITDADKIETIAGNPSLMRWVVRVAGEQTSATATEAS